MQGKEDEILWVEGGRPLFGFAGMGTSPVTGITGDGRDHCPLIIFVVLVEAKIFLVDFCSHLEHMTGGGLLRFVIAGKIQVTGGAVFGGGMTKIAFDAQRRIPAVHYLVQVIMADIFWQYFQVPFFWFVILGTDRGHADHHQGKKGKNNSKFLVMQHKRILGTRM